MTAAGRGSTFTAVRDRVLAWPETTCTPSYGGFPALRVNGTLLGRLLGEIADDLDLSTRRPFGEVLMIVVADLGEKDALLADDPASFFTTGHYDGHASILVRLDQVPRDVLDELLDAAWWSRAPVRARKARSATATAESPGEV